MAGIASVLHHLVKFAGELSEENRGEFHAAIDDFLTKVGIEGHTPEPEAAPAAELTADEAKIAELEAELAALKGTQAPPAQQG